VLSLNAPVQKNLGVYLIMSAYGGKADIADARFNVCF